MIQEAIDILNHAVEEYQPTFVVTLFSGGKDSLSVFHVVREWNKGVAAAHINTGIGIEETRDYVRRTVKCADCSLLEYRACDNRRGDGTPDPQIYEQLVLDQGFPGDNEFAHRKMYNRLKERPLRMMVREHAPEGNILLIAGCRSAESTRRMGNTKVFDKQGRWVWCNPLINWTDSDVYSFIQKKGLEINPVSQLVCHSWECGCGAFAKKGQLDELGTHYPYFKTRIETLQEMVWHKFPWGWEDRPPQWYLDKQKRGQGMLFEMAKPTPLCTSCVQGHEMVSE